GPTETVRGPDDLYTVSSRVTVDKRHSNSFTCRVQQNHINQTRETHVQISEDVFAAPSCSAVRIALIVSVCFLLSCVCGALFVYGRQTRNRGDKKMQHENKSEDGAGESGEGEQLVEGRTNRRDSDEQKLQEKQEEKTKIEHVISVLMEQKTELDTTRAKHRSELTKVEEERKKNEKKLEKIDHEFNVKKDAKKNELLNMKQQLDNEKTECQKSLQKIAQQLEKTEDIITIMTELKTKSENQVEQMKIQIEKKK
ncbi:stress response protein NST1-like, partial [Plectropomus leopardus]|uniref:stress response protein NST1-like n=1 Tax=Plectropomus leopardus TaxID=160734 RepID=UPI001C4CBDEE